MDTADKLAEIFKEFPGIGERQARRFVYFLMARNPAYVEGLAKLLSELKKETRRCKECFRFFADNPRRSPAAKSVEICELCSDPNADPELLMVVEKDSDLESIRKSGTYGGKYFVLGGLVPIVEKDTPKFVRIKELKERMSRKWEALPPTGGRQGLPRGNSLKEVILAFSLSPQGDHTDFYIRNELKESAEKFGIKISSLGRGLSTGTELEYSDNDTIKNALKNRQ